MQRTKSLNDLLREIKVSLPNLTIKRKEKFQSHTTMGVGGRIFAYIEVFDECSLIALLKLCQKHKVKYFILGNGSNIIASDKVYYGVVIKICLDSLLRKDNKITAGSGVNLFILNRFAIKEGLSGLEWSFGIPGSVGGGIKMNAGCFGHSMSEAVHCVYYTDGQKIFRKYNKNLDFDYRHSFFSNNNYVILRVIFNIKECTKAQINAKCVQYFEKKRLLQPYSMKSAGSIFKKPEDNFAPVLIEKCNLKGYKIGDAQVSTKHCGFIINLNKAKFSEISKIILKIKKTVFKKFGIMLQEEIIIIE